MSQCTSVGVGASHCQLLVVANMPNQEMTTPQADTTDKPQHFLLLSHQLSQSCLLPHLFQGRLHQPNLFARWAFELMLSEQVELQLQLVIAGCCFLCCCFAFGVPSTFILELASLPELAPLKSGSSGIFDIGKKLNG